MEPNGIEIQQATREMVGSQVLAAVTSMVDYIMARDDNDAPFTWDDVEGLFPDFDSMDLEEVAAYIDDVTGESWYDSIGFDEGEELEDWDQEVRDRAREISEEEGPAEIFEWYIVTSWLAARLREAGECIVDRNIWGRGCTGQAVYLDGVMQAIAVAANWGQLGQ